MLWAAALGVAGCDPATTPSPTPSSTAPSATSSSTAQPGPMEPTYRPPAGSAVLSVRNGYVSRTAGVAILFHPAGGAVTVTVTGAGRFRLCPSDATGLPVTGAASSSWGPAWPAGRCRLATGGGTARLPEPPDAHVGVLVVAADLEQAVSRVEVSYRPIDAFAAYRLGKVTPRPTLLRVGRGAGPVSATVYDECAAGAAYRIGDGSEQPTCRSTVTGATFGSATDGVLVRATGATAGPTPLIVVNWPRPPG